ncbi:MAG: 4Fe-4S dicluster domain-containing protein [Bryobacteraceae bacterium]
MCSPGARQARPATIQRGDIGRLIVDLKNEGYCVVGPVVRDGAIVYDEVTSESDLPAGWSDVQEAGAYRLSQNGRELFNFTVGPQSWKKFLHPPRSLMWRVERSEGGLRIAAGEVTTGKLAFLGVRSCELHAMAIQRKVFGMAEQAEAGEAARERDVFVVAVDCGRAGGTCFCESMNTGPRASEGFDLALTEVVDAARHYFVARAGTERGAMVLESLGAGEATSEEIAAAEAAIASQMGRTLDTDGIQPLLYRNYEHPRWDQVAERCLSCANCTMVCPTCFCSTIEDTTDLTGSTAERRRRWDSCFTADFSYIHGGSVRQSVKARYRQWLTHKLATWIEQFGGSGCVGCGRCITWCPAGIDLTEEVRAIRATEYKREENNGDSGTNSI